MKILKLKMSAFATYKDVVEINFENLIDHGLYLISGPTGSGKTTIFDAITFALYGTASGSERNQTYFRSDFANAQDETYVELTWTLHDKIYCIKRSPTYYRQGYKTPKMANAYLTYEGQTLEGVKEVNQKVKELLGVDDKQFKQIVMIAQGEFTKLIYATSEERERVLRHIFHTENYVQLEQLLKEETKTYKEKYMLLSQQLIHEFQSLQVSDTLKETVQSGIHLKHIQEAMHENEILKQEHGHIQKDYQQWKEKSEVLSKEYYQKEIKNKNIQLYQELKVQYHEVLQQDNAMKHKQQDIEKLKLLSQNQNIIYRYETLKKEHHHLQKDYQHLQQDIQELSNQLSLVEKDYQKVPDLKKQQDEKQWELSRYQEQQQLYQEYQDVVLHHQKLLQQHALLQDNYEQALTQHQQLENRMQRDQEKMEQLPQLQWQMKEMEQAVQQTNQKKVAIHQLSEIYDTYKNLQDKHYELSQLYQKKNHEYQIILDQYHQEDELFKRQQAGILARDLKEDEPCPVCGSTHHPQLAVLKEDVLSAHELELLMQEVEKKKKRNDEAYQDVMTHHQKIQESQSQMKIYKQQLNIEEELSKEVFIRLLSDVIQVTKQQEKVYQKQFSEIQYLTKLKHSYQQDQKIYEKESQALTKMLSQQHEIEKQLSTSENECMHFKKQFGEQTLEIITAQIHTLSQELKQVLQEIERIEKSYLSIKEQLYAKQQQFSLTKQKYEQVYNDYQKQKQAFQDFQSQYFQERYDYYQSQLSSLDTYEKQYQEYMMTKQTLEIRLKELADYQDEEVVDLSLFHQQLTQVEQHKDDLFQHLNHMQYVQDNNDKILKQLQKHYEKNQDIFDKYTLYQDLSDQTSGKNPKRMSFERYVLSHYFEHILDYANIELLKMSQGRYELYRKQEIKGTKQQGLDLSVMDYETGMLRDVQSLSGGESFKAALSLALGLSSMIQSYAGGIELNTLFIDEGFGSLDNESLDQALNVLLDLKNDNKVIGIISHVHELKERISAQIIVTKGKKGSSLHIEND